MAKQGKIYLHGSIGLDWWSDADNTSARFTRELNAHLSDDSINEVAIHINSVGGDVYEGLAIYNAIKASTKPTVAVIDGIAYSMGAIIALAANTSKIANNGMFMLHNVSGFARGNAKNLRTTADLLEKHDGQMAVSISAKTGLPENEVKNLWLNYEDNFFTAQEAVAASLVDELTDVEADLPTGFDTNAPLLKMAAQLSNHYKPKQETWFKKMAAKLKLDITAAAPNTTPTPENLDTMIIKNTQTALITALGAEPVEGDAVVNVVPTAEQIEILNNRLAAASAAEARVTALEADLANATAAQNALTAERDSLNAEVARLGALPGATPTPPSGADDKTDPPRALKSWEVAANAYLGHND